MRVITFSNNLLEINTYFLINDNNDCLLVDPGSNDDKIISMIQKNHLNLIGVVLTHAHFDHFLSCNKINIKFNVPLYIHSKGISLLYDPSLNVSAFMPTIKPLILDKNIEVISLNEESKGILDFHFDCFHVPGHSPDSICLYFKDDKLVFTGDTLFKGAIGRSDFPAYGNEKQLITNIKNKLFKLPLETTVYPGHGDTTTIEYEKKHNYFFK